MNDQRIDIEQMSTACVPHPLRQQRVGDGTSERATDSPPLLSERMGHPAGRRLRGRRGFILILVLGLTVVVTTLGISFLESNSTAMPEAVNRAAAARARYLAESGIALGTHFLLHDPTTVAASEYWTGGTLIAIDLTDDYTDVAIVQDVVDPKLFTISATGVAKDPDGVVRGKKQATAEVIVPGDGKWHLLYALLGSTMTIPATVNVNGDVHANGNLIGLGNCTKGVYASGTAAWPGTGPPKTVTSGVALVPRPPADPALYAAYNIRGIAYTAYTYNKLTMSSADALALNSINMDAINPGRIIMAPAGDFVFETNVHLTGTLVVQGNLTLDDGAVLNAVPNYLALVVSGNISFKKANVVAQIVGGVICGGTVTDGNQLGANLSIEGVLITSNGFAFTQTDGVFTLKWNRRWARFWDFQKSGEVLPITILSWKED